MFKKKKCRRIIIQKKVLFSAKSGSAAVPGRGLVLGSSDLGLLPPLPLAKVWSSPVGRFPLKTGARKRNLENLPLSAFCSAHDETTQRVAWRKSTPAPGPAFRTLTWASRDRRLAGTQPPAFCGTPPPSGPTSLPLHDEAEFYRVESTSRCPCPSPLITDIRMPRAAYVLVSLSLRGGHRRLCGPEGDSARAAGAHVCAQTLAESSPRAGSGPPPRAFHVGPHPPSP